MKPVEIKVTSIILTKNEEENIIDCIESVAFVDEIIIIDDNSEDRTVEIINNLKNEKISIFTHHLESDFSTQRNFALRQAQGEWVLFIDADERVSERLRYEIEYLLSSQSLLQQKLRGFYLRRTDFLWGRQLKYGETGNIKLLRLARRDAGYWVGKVHEVWKVRGKIGILQNPLLHYPHQTITEFLKEINFYTDIRSQELFQKGTRTYWWSIMVYPLGKFFLNYFLRRGFLDRIQGFIFAIMMSFHSFLVRGKLWSAGHSLSSLASPPSGRDKRGIN